MKIKPTPLLSMTGISGGKLTLYIHTNKKQYFSLKVQYTNETGTKSIKTIAKTTDSSNTLIEAIKNQKYPDNAYHNYTFINDFTYVQFRYFINRLRFIVNRLYRLFNYTGNLCMHPNPCKTEKHCVVCNDTAIHHNIVYKSSTNSLYLINFCQIHDQHNLRPNPPQCEKCLSYSQSTRTVNPSINNRSQTEQTPLILCLHCTATFAKLCATCSEYFLYREPNLAIIRTSANCGNCIATLLPPQINSWNYRPNFIFHPLIPSNPKNPLYIGLELEMNFKDNVDYHNQPIQKWIHELPRDLLYAKYDSSVIRGFEIVSHPMEPRWALDNFPFPAFQEIIEKHSAKETHPSTGTHIHMNKDAFTSAHLWKLLQLHFRLAKFCQKIGGRNSNNWASFEGIRVEKHRKELMYLIKNKKTGADPSNFARYVAVNLRNDHTIELRYPRGGIRPYEIKKNIEWALALYEFTETLTTLDIKAGAIDNTGYIRKWIQEGNYPTLKRWVADKYPPELELPSRREDT